MDHALSHLSSIQMLDHLLITFLLILPIILIARTTVSGTYYSPTLIIVIFGLLMGFALVRGGVVSPGAGELPLIISLSKVTVIALTASFFVGGQELKRMITKKKISIDDTVALCHDEIVLGTKNTQLTFIIRTFFILVGIEGATKLILGTSDTDPLKIFYPILTYIGLAAAIIFIDPKAQVLEKRRYLRRGVTELGVIITVLVISAKIAALIKPVIALPQIFFVMILTCTLGAVFHEWKFGPTLRALLFAGIPIVLAANFIVGGSLFTKVGDTTGLASVMAFGLFGQVFWMFGGLALLIWVGKANQVRNLGPGMAGALSHSGLTGACTADDFGDVAASRAPILINIPFMGHIFIFSILAASAERGSLYLSWSALLAAVGVVFVVLAMRGLRYAGGNDTKEIKSLMQFAFGLQIVAIFGGFIYLTLAGMNINDAAMSVTSSLSHFGLFAATQGGMFGQDAMTMVPLIFAMPFLVHPLVFGMFGKAMSNDETMNGKAVLILFGIGLLGIILAVTVF